jgi:3',5'-cyclic AMP phosphodiesterase CpdA
MPTINLLHISDLHMAETPMRAELAALWRKPKTAYRRVKEKEFMASHNPEVVNRLAAFAYKRRDYLNAIVITGDIATTGSTHDLNAGYRLITEPPDRIPYLTSDGDATLNLPDVPIFILPGNHDRYVPTKRNYSLTAGGREFHQIFGRWWTGDVQLYKAESGNYELGILAADFSLQDARHASFLSMWNKWAQGRIYPDILRDLENLTIQFHLDARDNGKKSAAIWAIHYPPNYPYESKVMGLAHRLNDEGQLLEAAKRCQVELILAGHTHEYQYYAAGLVTPFIFCAGTSSQFGPPLPGNYCHIISFDIDDSGYQYAVKHYRFDPVAGDFQYVSEGSS